MKQSCSPSASAASSHGPARQAGTRQNTQPGGRTSAQGDVEFDWKCLLSVSMRRRRSPVWWRVRQRQSSAGREKRTQRKNRIVTKQRGESTRAASIPQRLCAGRSRVRSVGFLKNPIVAISPTSLLYCSRQVRSSITLIVYKNKDVAHSLCKVEQEKMKE